MNFQAELAVLVMAGRKTVTRRLVSDNPRSPWWRERCALRVGRDYAVCPGRGKVAIGRVRVTSVRRMQLGHLSDEEALREGFPNAAAFAVAWAVINRGYEYYDEVWRVAFEAPRS